MDDIQEDGDLDEDDYQEGDNLPEMDVLQEEDHLQELNDYLEKVTLQLLNPPEMGVLQEEDDLQELNDYLEKVNLQLLNDLQEEINLQEEVNIEEAQDNREMSPTDNLRPPLQPPQAFNTTYSIDLLPGTSTPEVYYPFGPPSPVSSPPKRQKSRLEVAQSSTSRAAIRSQQIRHPRVQLTTTVTRAHPEEDDMDFSEPSTSRATLAAQSHPFERPILESEVDPFERQVILQKEEDGRVSPLPKRQKTMLEANVEMAELNDQEEDLQERVNIGKEQDNREMILDDDLRPLHPRQSPQVLQVAPAIDFVQLPNNRPRVENPLGRPTPRTTRGTIHGSSGRRILGRDLSGRPILEAQIGILEKPLTTPQSSRGIPGTSNQQISHPAPGVQTTSTVRRPPREDAIDFGEPPIRKRTINSSSGTAMPRRQLLERIGLLERIQASTQSSRGRTGIESGNQQTRNSARVQVTSTVSRSPQQVGIQPVIGSPSHNIQEIAVTYLAQPQNILAAAMEEVGLAFFQEGDHLQQVAGVGDVVGAVQVRGFDSDDINYLRNLCAPSEQYQILKHIATGSYGTVVEATRLSDNTPCAIKILKPIGLKATEQSIHNEVTDLLPFVRSKFNTHENVVTTYDIIAEPNPNNRGRYIVMELSTVGNLNTLITDRTKWQTFNEPNARYMMSGIAKAIAEMHIVSLVHGDIRPQNIILIDRPGEQQSIPTIELSKYIPKMCDFSKSRRRDRRIKEPSMMATRRIAHIHYSAPESGINDELVEPYNIMKADLFSLGCTLLALLFGGHPFVPYNVPNITNQDISLLKNVKGIHAMIKGFNFSDHLKDLLTKSLRMSPSSRPSATAFKSHEWFQ